MALNYSAARKGAAAIEDAAEQKGSGSGFRSFVPEIRWKEDNESKFILILTPIDEVIEIDLHEWIPVGEGEKANGEPFTILEQFMSRKDPLIGEDYDKLEDELNHKPKTRCYGVGVELEPVLEVVKGRETPTSFTVKTDTYTRRTDGDGEEEVTQPCIGLIIQNSGLMWSPLMSNDKRLGPLSELPLEIIRHGMDRNTHYDIVDFREIPVDISPILEYVDGISYLADDLEDLLAAMEAADNDLAAAMEVANALYTKRLEELGDGKRYEELIGPIDELPPDPWNKGKGKNKKASGGAKKRPSRPSRPSPRKRSDSNGDGVEEAPEAEATESESSEKEPDQKERFKNLRARVEAANNQK